MREACKLGVAVPGPLKDSEKTHTHICAHGQEREGSTRKGSGCLGSNPNSSPFQLAQAPVPVPSTGKWGGGTSDPAEVNSQMSKAWDRGPGSVGAPKWQLDFAGLALWGAQGDWLCPLGTLDPGDRPTRFSHHQNGLQDLKKQIEGNMKM